MQAIPMVMAAYSGVQAGQAGAANAMTLRQEGAAAEQQSVQQSNMLNRQGRESLGKSAAAIAQGGAGVGGSSAAEMDQAAVATEMDALNARYKGAFTNFGYAGAAREAMASGKAAESSAMAKVAAGAADYLYGKGSMG